MYCIKCGAVNDDDSRFCVKCGNDLRKEIIQREKWVNIFKIIIAIGLVVASLSLIIFIPKNQNGKDDIDNIDNVDIKDLNINVNNTPTVDTLPVVISSVPSNASIYINNIFKGYTPNTVNLPADNYTLTMNLTGYKSIVARFNITSDDIKNDAKHVIDVPMDKDIEFNQSSTT